MSTQQSSRTAEKHRNPEPEPGPVSPSPPQNKKKKKSKTRLTMSLRQSSRTAEKRSYPEPEPGPSGESPSPKKRKKTNKMNSTNMNDRKTSSQISSNVTDMSSSENTGRTQPVVEHSVNISTVQNYQAASNCRNVVFGNQVINTTKTDMKASNIKECTRSVLNSVDWRVYVETRAEKRGVELLKQNGVVIVVGVPGSGKTTLALRMMSQIENEEKRESYSLTHHTGFSDISLSGNKKCVVLIDDIFGKTNLISDFIESWKLKFPEIWSLVQKGSLKCIITLRKQIFSESETSLKEFGLFNEKHVLDLQSDDCCLDDNEMEEILNRYLKQKNIKMNKTAIRSCVVWNSCTELGFPQVCVYYVNSSDAQKRRVKFFKKPVEYLRQGLENLKNDKCSQINYLVLLLIMFQQGCLSIDSLDPFENDTDSDIMKLIRLLERVCPSLKNTDLKDIKKTADTMCGTYLNCCDNKYTFIHQSVFDSVFLMFSSEFPKKAAELLEVCPVSMLLEYVVTPGVSNKSHITMTVTPDCFDFLARRFTNLLASDNFTTIMSHPSLKDEEFVKYMTEEKHFYGKTSEMLHQRLCEIDQYVFQRQFIDVSEKTFPTVYVSFIYINIANEIFSNRPFLLDIYLIVQRKIINSTCLPSQCIVNRLRTLSRFFAENLCKMNLTYLKNELLDISCLFGDEDVVKMLLKSGVIPTFDTFSAAACSKRDSATIMKELLQCKKEMKLTLFSRLLYLSIYSDNMNIACMLADMVNGEKDNSEIKETAVKLLLVKFHTEVRRKSCYVCFENSDTSKVVDIRSLFNKLVTSDIINKSKDIAIIAVCQCTSSVIREIVKLKPDCINVENRDKVLLAAAMWGSTDTVKFLIEQRRNDTDENNWKKSELLKVAVIYNSADVVQFLLDKGADPNVNVAVKEKLFQFFEKQIALDCKFLLRDKIILKHRRCFKLLPSYTALHISVLRGDLDIIKSLIKRNADVNAVNSEGRTPLHETVEAVTHRKELALLLLENGADTDIRDKEKNSALHIASQIDIDVMKKVIQKGVDINVINTKGETPLLVSLNHNRPEIALYLLKQGADLNLTENDNNSVLHLAAEYGIIETVTTLFETGVDVNIKNNRGETPLFTAIKYKQNEVVLYLLEHGADPNLTDDDSNSVLHLAANQGNIEIVTALIEKGVDANIKNNRCKTALFAAIKCKQNKVVLYLLEHGADPNLTDKDNNSVLHLAANQGNIEIVTALVEKGVDVNIKNNRGETPLFTSVNYDEDEDEHPFLTYVICKVVLYLLEHGADPNLTDNDNNSVLHLTVKCANIEIVTALIEKGVDANIKNNRGETPLYTAVKYKQNEVVLYLLEHGADPNLTDDDSNSVLHLAANQGNTEIVTALIEKGVDVNIKNSEGETPLALALNYDGYEYDSSVNDEKCKVKFCLLEHGADPNLIQNDDNSVLHLAAKYGNIETVTALIKKGFDVNMKNSRGETPLFTAINCDAVHFHPFLTDEKCQVVLYLLEHGADPNLTDKDNNSVLHLAVEHGNTEIVTALIEKDVDVNIKNNRGETPLFTSVNYVEDYFGQYLNEEKCKVAFYLLEHGADLNLTDKDNNSVLHLAAEHGDIEIVTGLIEKGVDVNVINSNGETPLDKAVSCRFDFNKRKIVLYLREHGAKDSSR